MSKSKVILFDKAYIPEDIIINKSLFKQAFVKTVNEDIHTLFKYYAQKGVYSVNVGSYDLAKGYLDDHEVCDKRIDVPLDITCNFIGTLRPEQVPTMKEWVASDDTCGTLVARAGAGKTCMMSWLIAHMQQKTLVLVPSEKILTQWKRSIYDFLGVVPNVIGGGKFSVGDITVASYKSLISAKGRERVKQLQDKFGLIIIDEAHKACAKGWRELVASLPAKHKVACTATRFRKDKTIFYLDGLVGRRVVTMTIDTAKKALITIVRTDVPFYFKDPEDYIKALGTIAEDMPFNTIVAKRIAADHRRKRSIICISPRIEQLENIEIVLNSLDIPCGRLVSVKNTQTVAMNDALLHEVRTNGWVLLATNTLVGEGFDEPILDCMHVPYSYNNEGNFIQYVGRIERKFDGKPIPEFKHYYFRDKGMSQFQQATMQGLYSKLGYEVDFDDDELHNKHKPTTLTATKWVF